VRSRGPKALLSYRVELVTRPKSDNGGATRHGATPTTPGSVSAGDRAAWDRTKAQRKARTFHRRRLWSQPGMTSRARRAVSLGVRPTRTPTFSSASFLAWAVPDEPDTMAPAWPMVFPSGAVNPAT
jgi:hypothetical protein